MLTLLERRPKEKIPLALELLKLGQKLLCLHINVSNLPETVEPVVILKSYLTPDTAQFNPKNPEIDIHRIAESYDEIQMHVLQEDRVLSVITQKLLEHCAKNITIVLHGRIDEQEVMELITTLKPLNPTHNLSIWFIKKSINASLLKEIIQFNFSSWKAALEETSRMMAPKGFGALIPGILNLVMEYLKVQDYDHARTNSQKEITYDANQNFFPALKRPKSEIREANKTTLSHQGRP
jgi:hypothetical protein